MEKPISRGGFLKKTLIALTAAAGPALLGVFSYLRPGGDKNARGSQTMANSAIYDIRPLGFQWETADPFLFCVHHEDYYPAGNGNMGPQGSLAGRNIGQDFTPKEGWRMYHGEKIPGFPNHPHRGFETVTVVRRGFVDHSDSMGAAGRYGAGDVQWMTAGAGVQHAEMFPLIENDKDNTLELFQIWLNLPAANKMVQPHFKMLWNKDIPRIGIKDSAGRETLVELIAGSYKGSRAVAPPPDSWAAKPDNSVAIWHITIPAKGEWILPAAAAPGLNRFLYFFSGDSIEVAGSTVAAKNGLRLDARAELTITAGDKPALLLLLQGKPIAESVAQYGPFVMNTRAEIEQAFADYQRTHFGGWPWPSSEPVHGREKGRFARHADGKEEIITG